MAIEPCWKEEARASEVLRKLSMNKFPINPFAVAEAHEILYRENASLSSGISGCLMKIGDVFGIMYSTRFASNGFKRFTVGHELGHYFLEGHVDQLFGAGQQFHQSDSGFLSDKTCEKEADAFAAALLMPKSIFQAAIKDAGEGLDAVEALAEICGTSLTATSIRFANLVDIPVAVVCSKEERVSFAFMSDGLKKQRNLMWIKKGAGLPQRSTTAAFNRDIANVQGAKRATGQSSLADWFHGDDLEINEDVIGLGEYGRTLTILWADSLPDPEVEISTSRADGREDDEAESLLPSQRFYQKPRY
jgi:Zn-dependent peptidase ImmA (M78 family)